MALYETARALGLTCVIRPLLSLYHQREEDDDYYEDTITLMGSGFPAFIELDDELMRGDEYLKTLEYHFGDEHVDQSKVTWLNRRGPEEPALAHLTVWF